MFLPRVYEKSDGWVVDDSAPVKRMYAPLMKEMLSALSGKRSGFLVLGTGNHDDSGRQDALELVARALSVTSDLGGVARVASKSQLNSGPAWDVPEALMDVQLLNSVDNAVRLGFGRVIVDLDDPDIIQSLLKTRDILVLGYSSHGSVSSYIASLFKRLGEPALSEEFLKRLVGIFAVESLIPALYTDCGVMGARIVADAYYARSRRKVLPDDYDIPQEDRHRAILEFIIQNRQMRQEDTEMKVSVLLRNYVHTCMKTGEPPKFPWPRNVPRHPLLVEMDKLDLSALKAMVAARMVKRVKRRSEALRRKDAAERRKLERETRFAFDRLTLQLHATMISMQRHLE